MSILEFSSESVESPRHRMEGPFQSHANVDVALRTFFSSVPRLRCTIRAYNIGPASQDSQLYLLGLLRLGSPVNVASTQVFNFTLVGACFVDLVILASLALALSTLDLYAHTMCISYVCIPG